MYCESCGSFVRDGQAYCTACGAEMPFVPAAPAPAPAPQSVPVYVQPPVQQPVYAQPHVQQPAGQPLAQSVEIDYNAYQAAQRVQIVPPRPISPENPNAKRGLICGIITMATMYFGCVNAIPAILGIVFSLKGMSDSDKLGNRGSAIAGMVLSIVGASLGIYATVMFILNLTGNIS